jgi:NADH:ubiquinone oxidoreductase subunit 5 (subunit L)/multisubunit Na+/H+ antiporter MnhA subunit
MHDESDSEFARYFSYLNLFAAFMLVLVLGSNFPVMFVGWEGVGLCFYLLIGFWFKKKSAADAGKKAFVVNRIGDYAFILGMLALFARFGSLDFQTIAGRVAGLPPENHVRHPVDLDAAALHRRHRQVRADSAVHLAAGRHGRPDARCRPSSTPRRW